MEQKELKNKLHYDPLTGTFRWRTTARKGRLAGTLSSLGYVKIKIDRREYSAHRLAVLYMTGFLPTQDVDHKNCTRHDNRWVNLRVVPRQVNARNRAGANKNNACGWVGAHEFRAGKWASQINAAHGKQHLGVFSTPEEAHLVYLMAKEFYFADH
jgi:hypothetical protein